MSTRGIRYRARSRPSGCGYALLVLGSLVTIGGALMLKWASPSPHGLVEMWFAMPAVAVGAALISIGFFHFRSRNSLIAGLLAGIIAIGGFPIPILIAVSGIDGDGAYGPVYHVLLGPTRLTYALFSPFVDPLPEDPMMAGTVYTIQDPPPGAQSKVLFADGIAAPSPGAAYVPVEGAEISLWDEAVYRCDRELREFGACAGAVPVPLDSARSDSNGRFTLIYPFDLFREIPPRLVHAEMVDCEEVDARVGALQDPIDRVITILLVCTGM